MAQHFLLSAAARSLSPGKVARMSERGAENVFVRLRWPQTDGKPVCPHCGCQICYDCRRSEHQPRCGELGHHHHISGPYVVRYAQEAAWREDLRRVSNDEQVYGMIGLAMRCPPSVDFCGYWQRAQAA